MHQTNHGYFDYGKKKVEDPQFKPHAEVKMVQVLVSLVDICETNTMNFHEIFSVICRDMYILCSDIIVILLFGIHTEIPENPLSATVCQETEIHFFS